MIVRKIPNNSIRITLSLLNFSIPELNTIQNCRKFVLGGFWLTTEDSKIQEQLINLFGEDNLELINCNDGEVDRYTGCFVDGDALKLNEAEEWYNGLTEYEQNNVQVLIKEWGLHPAMAYPAMG